MTKAKAAPLPKNLTFEKALARLQEIVGELEDPEKGLETSLALFEEGVTLSRFCRAKIDEIRSRVEVVLKETPEGFETKELEGSGGAEEDEDEEGNG
ncbi:MAG TPA: exodeoxyribonuclease VII small subunit [Thermoanaerobaculia bacterium]|jgi:exodeoxyribonuclease VII small subunit|nr:exodeoxyribonuclease VII small subunit [Thermoanaerobaculia bacterium]HQR66001.1 exodeoxyribonuclease VII small subunit [Thermoanaerobaculia bacterium]